MKYPTILRDDWKNVKIKTNDISDITQLYNSGMSLRDISTQYNVSIPTIRRYVDPEYKERQYECNHIRTRLKWSTDPEFRRKNNIRSNKFHKNQIIKERVYKNQQVKEWYRNNDRVVSIDSKLKNKIRDKKWKEDNKYKVKDQTRRYRMRKYLTGFRMFMNRVENYD